MLHWFRRLLSRSYHLWGWRHTLLFATGFSFLAAFASGVMFTAWQWYGLLPQLKNAYTSYDFITTIAAYTVLFFILGLGVTLFYLFAMGWVVMWMGRTGHLIEMDYGRSCRLALVTGVPVLALVLVFGQMLGMSTGVAALLMVAHGLWLRGMQLPPPLPEQAGL